MKIVVKIKTSCDDQFIKRVAHSDPFEYWNRCIAPGTGREEFDLDNINLEISINKTHNSIMNYEIIYNFDMFHKKHNNVISALMMYFGTFNVEVIKF